MSVRRLVSEGLNAVRKGNNADVVADQMWRLGVLDEGRSQATKDKRNKKGQPSGPSSANIGFTQKTNTLDDGVIPAKPPTTGRVISSIPGKSGVTDTAKAPTAGGDDLETLYLKAKGSVGRHGKTVSMDADHPDTKKAASEFKAALEQKGITGEKWFDHPLYTKYGSDAFARHMGSLSVWSPPSAVPPPPATDTKTTEAQPVPGPSPEQSKILSLLRQKPEPQQNTQAQPATSASASNVPVEKQPEPVSAATPKPAPELAPTATPKSAPELAPTATPKSAPVTPAPAPAITPVVAVKPKEAEKPGGLNWKHAAAGTAAVAALGTGAAIFRAHRKRQIEQQRQAMDSSQHQGYHPQLGSPGLAPHPFQQG